MNEFKFDTKCTKLSKGIAIILMVCNHIYPILDWIYDENKYVSIMLGSKSLAAYIGGFGKICVAIFAFLTGYGLFYTYTSRKTKDAYLHTLKKLLIFCYFLVYINNNIYTCNVFYWYI